MILFEIFKWKDECFTKKLYLSTKLLSIYSILLNKTILQYIGATILRQWSNNLCILNNDKILDLHIFETTAIGTKYRNVPDEFQMPYYI
jgi:hypothetical protein